MKLLLNLKKKLMFFGEEWGEVHFGSKAQPLKGRAMEKCTSSYSSPSNYIFLLIFSILCLVFLYDLIFLGKTFSLCDYQLQHYPWTKFYADSLKNFTLPFWNHSMHLGFPLLAEGQIGALYPLNFIFYFLFPFKLASNLNVFVHFFLGGLFFFLYCRFLKLNFWAGTLGAVLWMFGTAYGGLQTNFSAMRALIWFPLVLLLTELFIEKKGLKYVLWLVLIGFLQLTAGYLQLCLYCFVFYAVYFLALLFRDKNSFKELIKLISFYGIAFVLAIALASPQILATFELAQETSRFISAGIDFALVGSFSPLGLFSLIFPYATGIISGFRLYIGILPLFFIVYLFFQKKNFYFKLFITLFLISLFCSFGKFNPLYVWLIKIFKLYSLRVPGKFTYFSIFCLIILVSLGIDKISNLFKKEDIKKAFRIFSLVSFLSAGFFIVVGIILRVFKSEIIGIGKWYVKNHYFGKSFHPHSLEDYYGRVASFYHTLLTDSFNLLNLFNLAAIFLILVSVVFLIVLIKKQISRRSFFIGVFLIIVLDLFIFSFYGSGFRGNLGNPFDLPSKEVRFLKSDESLFRIFSFQNGKTTLELIPNENIYYDIDQAGAYSPLVTQKYFNLFQGIGGVDDSTGYRIDKDQLETSDINFLSLLNVKYIFSCNKLNSQQVKFLFNTSKGNYLYQNLGVLLRAFLVNKLRVINDDKESLRFIKSDQFQPSQEIILKEKPDFYQPEKKGRYQLEFRDFKSDFIKIEVDSDFSGFLLLSNLYYPGWEATIDGKKTEIYQTNYILSSIWLPQGKHQLVFAYNPKAFRQGLKISKVTLIVILILLLLIIFQLAFRKDSGNSSNNC